MALSSKREELLLSLSSFDDLRVRFHRMRRQLCRMCVKLSCNFDTLRRYHPQLFRQLGCLRRRLEQATEKTQSLVKRFGCPQPSVPPRYKGPAPLSHRFESYSRDDLLDIIELKEVSYSFVLQLLKDKETLSPQIERKDPLGLADLKHVKPEPLATPVKVDSWVQVAPGSSNELQRRLRRRDQALLDLERASWTLSDSLRVFAGPTTVPVVASPEPTILVEAVRDLVSNFADSVLFPVQQTSDLVSDVNSLRELFRYGETFTSSGKVFSSGISRSLAKILEPLGLPYGPLDAVEFVVAENQRLKSLLPKITIIGGIRYPDHFPLYDPGIARLNEEIRILHEVVMVQRRTLWGELPTFGGSSSLNSLLEKLHLVLARNFSMRETAILGISGALGKSFEYLRSKAIVEYLLGPTNL